MTRVRTLNRLGLASTVALAMLAAIAPAASAGTGGTTRWVDNDGKAGPSGCSGNATAFTHVQPAVNASGAGDTVLVCPGTYRGVVDITGSHGGITVRGVTPWTATLIPPKGASGFNSHLLLVDGVSNVTVRGLRFQVPVETNCAFLDIVVAVFASQNVSVRGNQVYASPNSTDCGYYNGILVNDAGITSAGTIANPKTTVAIEHNLISNFAFWGIAAGNSQDVTAQIIDNSLHYYRTARIDPPIMVAAGRGAPSHFSSRPSRWNGISPAGPGSSNQYRQAGIILVGSTHAVVSLNVIQSAQGAPLGFQFAGLTAPAPDTLTDGIQLFEEDGGVILRDNLVRRVNTGIDVQSIGATIDENRIRNTSTGMFFGNLGFENRVRDNISRGIQFGIFVDGTMTQNAFRRNQAHWTGALQGAACVDDSTGSGTAGTGNIWTHNTGNVDSPDGICPKPV